MFKRKAKKTEVLASLWVLLETNVDFLLVLLKQWN